jgi:membrane protein DedA with SNARE-associated domain
LGQLITSNYVYATARRFGTALLSIPRWTTLLLVLIVGGVLWISLETPWITVASEFVARESPLLVALNAGQVLLNGLGYPGLVLVIFVENVFPPIPSDIILPLAGYTAATTTMTLFGVIVATTGGSLIGAMTLYGAGAWMGEERVRRLSRRYGRYLTFEEEELDRSLDWFRRHGSVVVMVARVVPVFRSLISIPAGMSRMPIGKFLIFTALGAGAWNSGLISAGYLLGTNWELVVNWMDNYQLAMIAVSTGVFLVVATLRVRSFRRRNDRIEPGATNR